MKITSKTILCSLVAIATILPQFTIALGSESLVFNQDNAIVDLTVDSTVAEGASLSAVTVESSALLDRAISGTIDVDNLNSTQLSDYNAYESLFALELAENIAGQQYLLDNLSIKMTSAGTHSSSSAQTVVGIHYNGNNDMGDIRNTQITIIDEIVSNPGYPNTGAEGIYGINAQNATINSIDSNSRIDISTRDDNAAISGSVFGIRTQNIENFDGSINIVAYMGSSKANVYGIALHSANDASLPSNIAGAITIENTGSSSDTAGLYIEASSLRSSTISTEITLKNSLVPQGDKSMTGISLVNSEVGTISSIIDVTGNSSSTYGIRSNPLGYNEKSYIGTISSQITLSSNYVAYHADATFATGVDIRLSGFGSIASSNSIEVKGSTAGVGLNLSVHQQDPNPIIESGSIGGSITVHTDETIHMMNKVATAEDALHYKSTAALRVVDQARFAYARAAILNFDDGLKLSATVGENAEKYGDALYFNTGSLNIKASSDAAKISITGDISGANEFINSSGKLTFENGTYDVHSSHWFVSEVGLGNKADRSTTQINLLDSTKFVDTAKLNFHVNSESSHSQIALAPDHNVNLSSLTEINVSLSADVLSQDVFTVVLIDGLITSDGSTSFTLNLEDLDNIGHLDTVDVWLNGQKYDYTDGGLLLELQGSDNTLALTRGIDTPEIPDNLVPEPSTATLSLLALAGLMSRRRRRVA